MSEIVGNISPNNKRLLKLLVITLCILITGFLVYMSNRSLSSSTDKKVKAAELQMAPQDNFITRSGPYLYLNGTRFRFAGPNIYWLGLDDNFANQYPTHFRIDDALATAQEMGATVVRSHSLGISTGSSYSVEPSKDNWNDAAFEPMDYAIRSAYDHHIRLIIPLTDMWSFASGGKADFARFEQILDAGQFFNYTGSDPRDQAIIQDFKNYINHLLTHPNPYRNNMLYKDDPTIMAWETGNELYIEAELTPYPSPIPTLQPYQHITAWTEYTANYIKSVDPNHLVADGFAANADSTHIDANCNDVNCPHVDMVSGHYYPSSGNTNSQNYITQYMEPDANTAYNNNKVFFVGEYDWTGLNSTLPSLSTTLSAVENNATSGDKISGDLYWMLESHGDNFGFIHNSEHWAMHYPGGGIIPSPTPAYDAPDTRTRSQLLRAHAYAMQGISVPPAIQTSAPLVHNATGPQNGTIYLYWRGVVGGDHYQIERSVDQGTTWSIVGSNYTDGIDASINSNWPGYVLSGNMTDYYRVAAFNMDNTLGDYGYSSNVLVTPTPGGTTSTPMPSPSPMPTNTPTLPSPTPTPVDTILPSVAIINPLNNATVTRNSNVTITATASDNTGVTKVEFYVGNSLTCTDTTATYSCVWHVPAKRGVYYTLKAKAYDAANNSATYTVAVRSN